MDKEILTCTIKKTKNGYEFDCGKEQQGFCVIGTEGKSGGISALGLGGNAGYSRTTLVCHDREDLRKTLSKKYKKKVRFDWKK